MQQDVQKDATCNIPQRWELLAKVASCLHGALLENLTRQGNIIERRSRYVTLAWKQNFWMITNRKRFKLHRSYSISFHLSNVDEISGVELQRTVSKFRKKNILCCVHLLKKRGRETKKFHEAVVQRRPRNVKKLMHVQSCGFANLNLLLFPFSLPPSWLLVKLPIIVIQYFCYHGNLTSHFSSLFA